MDPSEIGNIEVEFNDDGTLTTSEDVPYAVVLELVPISGPENWSYAALSEWISSLNPKKLLTGIIIIIFAFIITFLRIKICRGDEEMINISEHVQEEVNGVFFQTVDKIMSFFRGFRCHHE